ncbi:MAG TPA: hypothetical protein VHF27_00445 [Acidimicrobiales bacterium]|nr:hypothetical protein [Acidimicrobiales bacterium]
MNEGLGPLADGLAELLGDERGARVLAHLQRLAVLADEPGARSDPSPRRDRLRVGVWEPRRVDGGIAWSRTPSAGREWRFWADVDTIGPKRTVRVVLLGESTARGYLFDPELSFAAVLQSALEAAAPRMGLEVVDLARSDLTLQQLARLAPALPGFQPDVVVLFAGNNWANFEVGLEDLDLFAGALRRGGVAEARRLAVDERLPRQCRSLLLLLRECLRPAGAKLVVVVPEFNLSDWRPDPTVGAPLLPEAGAAGAAWTSSREAVVEALAAGEARTAARLAEDLVRLDGGTSAASAHLAARAAVALSDEDAARRWFQRARDAPCGTFVPHTPRCPTILQEALRAGAAEHGFALVDLPRVFAHAAGALPGRRFFLDYCHLSFDGMATAAGAIASEVLGLLSGAARANGQVGARKQPPAATQAVAHLLAAVHNAHHAQPDEILRHHCEMALACDPGIAEDMEALLHAQCGRRELWLAPSFERFLSRPLAARYLHPEDGRTARLADFALIESMVEALEASGTALRPRVQDALIAQHGAGGGRDLVDRRYRRTTAGERVQEGIPGPTYVRANDVRSMFYLVSSPEPGPVRLSLTARVPGAGPGERVDVRLVLAGRAVARVRASSRWETYDVDVPAGVLHRGVNRMILEWCAAAPRAAGSLEAAARQLERGEFPDVLPVFGEVYSLRS